MYISSIIYSDDEKYGGQLLESSFVWDGIAKSLAFSYLFSVLSIVFVGSVGFILYRKSNIVRCHHLHCMYACMYVCMYVCMCGHVCIK